MTKAPLGNRSGNPAILTYMNAQHELPMKHTLAFLAARLLAPWDWRARWIARVM